MKLTKKDRARLSGILADLKEAQNFIRLDRVLVCTRRSGQITTLDFANKSGEFCCSIDKEIGSKLAHLHTAVGKLESILNPHEVFPTDDYTMTLVRAGL